jgi:hypothetical protein
VNAKCFDRVIGISGSQVMLLTNIFSLGLCKGGSFMALALA